MCHGVCVFYIHTCRDPYDWRSAGCPITWAAMDSGTGITGGGSGETALLAHAQGVLYGTELGSVTLERVGLFCFPVKHSNTHTGY